MSNPKISISFSKKHLHVYEYLMGKENISAYLNHLIQADMDKQQQEEADWEMKVEEVVVKVLSRLDPKVMSEVTKVEAEKTEAMSQEDKELLNSLF